MKLIVSALLVLLSASAFADLNGTFSGKGSYLDGHGNQHPCQEITFEIRQSKKLLTMKYGYY